MNLPYEFLSPTAGLPRGNVTIAVTEMLREAIVGLDMKPGELIDKTAICERLGISRFPVSEALARLGAEGLVDILPQRGTSVSLIRMSEVTEFMLIRKAMEAEVARALAAVISDRALLTLEADLEVQRRAAETNDRAAFLEADYLFHEHMFIGLELPRIKTIIDTARANVDRARRLTGTPARLARTIGEHELIVSAFAARDSQAAAEAMSRHIQAVMDDLEQNAASHPALFAPEQQVTSSDAR